MTAEHKAVKSLTAGQQKAERLREMFPPDEVGWDSKGATGKAKPGDMITVTPFVPYLHVLRRLDGVLGVECWSEEYTTLPNGHTRCTLLVAFEPGADWVMRVGVSESQDTRRAQAESLREAAAKFGVGRYLDLYPDVIKWDGKGFERAARLPEKAVPEGWRPCGRERAQQIRAVMDSAVKAANKALGDGQKPISVDEVGLALCAWKGYKREGLKFADVQNRHATEILQRLNKWIAEIASGKVLDGPECPLAGTEAAPTKMESKTEPPKQKLLPQQAQQQAQQPPQQTPSANGRQKADEGRNPNAPSSGAELLARLEAKDKEMWQAGLIIRGALKTHVVSRGADLALSMDVTRWTVPDIDKAIGWAKEFIDHVPEEFKPGDKGGPIPW